MCENVIQVIYFLRLSAFFFFFVEDVDSRTVSRERSGAGAAMQMSSFGCSPHPPTRQFDGHPRAFQVTRRFHDC